MMKCPEPEKLLAYIEDGPRQVSRAEARHIRRCKTCAAQIAELREVGDVLRPRATPAPPLMDAKLRLDALRRPQRARFSEELRLEEPAAFEALAADVESSPSADVEPAGAEQAEALARARQEFLRRLDTEGATLKIRGAVSDLQGRLSELMATHPGLAPGHLGGVVAEQVAFDVLPRPPFEGQFTHSRLAFDAHPADDLTAALSSLMQAIEGAFNYYRRNNYECLRRPETAESDRAEMMDILRRTIDLWEAYLKATPDKPERPEAEAQIDRLQYNLERLRSARKPEQP